MKNEMRLAFLGDVTCDRPMLKAAFNGGKYDFTRSLGGLRRLTVDADYVVANLETVFGGEEFGFNPYPITYNSPDSLCEGLTAAGINVVTTANNHCLDMGGPGIDRTLRILDEYGLKHTGTFAEKDYGDRFLILEQDGIRVAIVSFTDEINNKENGATYSEQEWNQVNCLHSFQEYINGRRLTKNIIKKILPMTFINQVRAAYKRLRCIPLVAEKIDNQSISQEGMLQIEETIKVLDQAREKSDFVIVCVHCGGQFNYEPGSYSTELYDLLEPHCDSIIGNHPHVVQRMKIDENKIRAYSLGSVNMSPSADYVHHGTDFDYSILLNILLEKDHEKVTIKSFDYKIIHAIEDDTHYVTVSEASDGEKSKIVSRRFYNP